MTISTQTYQNFYFSGSIPIKKRATGEKKCINYYPFGLKHKGYNNVTSANGNSVAQRWKFGGMEYQEELNLNWYDVSARNYDPALGRWMNIDPLAEQMRRHSPYNYAFDNPIYYIDPDGMSPHGPGPGAPKPIGLFDLMKKVTHMVARFLTADPVDPKGSGKDHFPGSGIEITGAPHKGDSGQSTSDNPKDNIEVPFEVIDAMSSFATAGKNPKSGDGKTDATSSTSNTASKIGKEAGDLSDGMDAGNRVTQYAETTIDAMNFDDKDTTFTYQVPSGISDVSITASGKSVSGFANTKDTTVTISSSKVSSTIDAAQKAIEEQQKKLEKKLDSAASKLVNN